MTQFNMFCGNKKKRTLFLKLLILSFLFNNSAYISDCNKISKSNITKLKNLNYFIVDCLRFKLHPSHFSFNEVLSILKEIKPAQTILTNLHSSLDYNILLKYIRMTNIIIVVVNYL